MPQGGKCADTRELAQVSDWGEQTSPSLRQLEG
ncbi:addiction module toxin RelE [Lelliottia amnigena]|nr:addiction module toxin RelE [Lelliottia amnigena]PEG65445.1 addiction module toxin RelE [Lelliottia amnigena]